jgi:nicotinamide mononucleotide transporter
MLLILELAAVISGFLYVVLAIAENRMCWIFGAISSFIYTLLYLPQKYFVFAGLNLFYTVMAVIGFFQWSRPKESHPPVIRKMELPQLSIHILLALASAGILFYILNAFQVTYTMTAFEAVAGGSALAAMLATIRKLLENWLFWIFSNLTYVALFILEQKFPTAGLYLAFTVMAVIGYFRWRKIYYNRVA